MITEMQIGLKINKNIVVIVQMLSIFLVKTVKIRTLRGVLKIKN